MEKSGRLRGRASLTGATIGGHWDCQPLPVGFSGPFTRPRPLAFFLFPLRPSGASPCVPPAPTPAEDSLPMNFMDQRAARGMELSTLSSTVAVPPTPQSVPGVPPDDRSRLGSRPLGQQVALAHSCPLPPAGACGTPVGSAAGQAISCPRQRPASPPPSTAAPCPTHLRPVCVPLALPWILRSGRGLVTLGEGPLSAARSPQSSPDPAASGGLVTPPPSLWGSGQQLPPGGSKTTLLALLLPVLPSLHMVLSP